MLAHAITAGEELLAVKASLRHGEFQEWCRGNLSFSERLVQSYMRLAKAQTSAGFSADLSINALEPVMKQHRVVMDTSVVREDLKRPSVHSGLYQMTHLSSARGSLKHDDMVDVLAFATSYWIEHLNTDARDAEAERIRKVEMANEALFFAGTRVAQPRRRGLGRPPGRRR